jgi:hypothetical protein
MHGNAEIDLCDKHIANIALNGKKLICFFKNQKEDNSVHALYSYSI